MTEEQIEFKLHDIRREKVSGKDGYGWQWGYKVYSGDKVVFQTLDEREAADYVNGTRSNFLKRIAGESLPAEKKESWFETGVGAFRQESFSF